MISRKHNAADKSAVRIVENRFRRQLTIVVGDGEGHSLWNAIRVFRSFDSVTDRSASLIVGQEDHFRLAPGAVVPACFGFTSGTIRRNVFGCREASESIVGIDDPALGPIVLPELLLNDPSVVVVHASPPRN